jgi:hypothetical protein
MFEIIDEIGFATIDILKIACNSLLVDDTSTEKALQQRLSILKKQNYIKTMHIPDATIYQLAFNREHGTFDVPFWQLQHETFLAELYILARSFNYKVTSSRLCQIQKIENIKSKSVVKIPDVLFKIDDNPAVFFEYERTAKSKTRAEQFIKSYQTDEMKSVKVLIYTDSLAVYNVYTSILSKLIKNLKSSHDKELDIYKHHDERIKFIYCDKDVFKKKIQEFVKFE